MEALSCHEFANFAKGALQCKDMTLKNIVWWPLQTWADTIHDNSPDSLDMAHTSKCI